MNENNQYSITNIHIFIQLVSSQVSTQLRNSATIVLQQLHGVEPVDKFPVCLRIQPVESLELAGQQVD